MSVIQFNQLFIIFLALFFIIGCQSSEQNQESVNNQNSKNLEKDNQNTENKDSNSRKTMKKITDEKIVYVSLGDSYTKGEGILREDNYPNQLVQQLQVKGVDISLASNPSESGWTTKQVIDLELKEIKEHQPNLVTLLIGVNDWVQGRSKEDFQQDFVFIVDDVLKTVPKERFIIITIPDFSTSPNGNIFSNGRDISAGIAQFNSVIRDEATKRDLKVVDIFPLSQDQVDPRYYAADGLHYSAIAYEQWVELMMSEIEKSISSSEN